MICSFENLYMFDPNDARSSVHMTTITEGLNDVKLTEYREWRQSMRTSQYGVSCIFSQNGNCQEYLEFEDEDKYFRRHYVVLDIESFQVQIYKDRPKPKVKFVQPRYEIDICSISKVSKVTHKVRKQYSFEIHTPKRRYVFAASCEENMDVWVTALTKAASNPTPQLSKEKHKDVSRRLSQPHSIEGYTDGLQTSIIGGVIVRTPVISKSNRNQASNKAMSQFKRKSTKYSTFGSSFSTTGSLRLLCEGWCWKQGYYMKNWKKRYFRLNAIKLAYYETNEEGKEPIRVILNNDIKGVRVLPKFCNRINCLEVETPKRKFYMDPEDIEQVNKWKKAIEDIILATSQFLPRTRSI